MTSSKANTSVRRRRIAGERSRPGERPAPKAAAPKQASPPRGPRKPPSAPSATGWRPNRQTLAWFVPLCVLSVVAAGFAIGLGVLELTDDDPLDAAAREDAVAPAGQAAEALLSFRYDTLDQELESERGLMTDSYADEFLNVFPPQAREVTTDRQATVESRVLAAAPLECGDQCSDDSVQVLVFLDTETTVAGEAPDVSPNRAVMAMQREDGEWRVAGIDLF
jgi:Mce-associated membrane protein